MAQVQHTTDDGFGVSSNTETVEQMTATPDAAPPAAETAAPVVAPVDVVPEPVEAVDPEPATDSDAGKQLAKKRKSLQDRIDELTREKYDSRREADEAKRERDALKVERDALKQPKAAAPVTDGEPQPDQFDTYEKYVKAQARWETQQELKAERAQREQETAQRAHTDALSRFREQGLKAHPDFDDVQATVNRAGITFSAPVADVLLNHPLGHDVAYLLAQDLDDCRRIASISHPVIAGLELGKYLARLDAAPSGPAVKAPVLSTAKPPIKPVGSSPTTSDESPGDTDSLDQHAAYWNRKERESRRRA